MSRSYPALLGQARPCPSFLALVGLTRQPRETQSAGWGPASVSAPSQMHWASFHADSWHCRELGASSAFLLQLSSVLEDSKDSSWLPFEWDPPAPGSRAVASAGFAGSTMVFFDMKVNRDTQMITQLAAVSGESSFKAVIQTPESVLSLISQGVSLETGLEHFLCYLRSVPKPLLVVHNFWASELTVLFKALESLAKKWDFCTAVCAYLDTLPLLRERIPMLGRYKLKNLVRMCLHKPLNDSSALASAKALRDLCKHLEIHTNPDPRSVRSHCNLESYTSLQSLLQEKLLTRSAAKTLAMRSMVLCVLQES